MTRCKRYIFVFVISSFILGSHAWADTELACPSSFAASDVTAWRTAAIALAPSPIALSSTMSLAPPPLAVSMQRCFSNSGQQAMPACLSRLYNYLTQYYISDGHGDVSPQAAPAKQPPPELVVSPAASEYIVRTDIEQIAKDHHWPAVRYKSRHSGGFDPETPSLLIVYVAGDQVQPPVPFDRWINFTLPADQGSEALNPLPQADLPTVGDLSHEEHDPHRFPRTFTIVAVDRSAGTPQVVFQRFLRSELNSPVYRPELNVGPFTCSGCHPNGLRQLSPLGFHVRAGERRLPEEAWQTVAQINAAMETARLGQLVDWRRGLSDSNNLPRPAGDQGPPQRHTVTASPLIEPRPLPPGITQLPGAAVANPAPLPLLRPKNYWPIVGAMQPLNSISRTQAFILGGTLPDGQKIEGCYASRRHIDVRDINGRAPGAANVYDLSPTPHIDWHKVSLAMRCASCHDNVQRYALNADTVVSHSVDYKILVDQTMPYGGHVDPSGAHAGSPPTDLLNPDERIALANCLLAELDEEASMLQEYLTQDSCQ